LVAETRLEVVTASGVEALVAGGGDAAGVEGVVGAFTGAVVGDGLAGVTVVAVDVGFEVVVVLVAPAPGDAELSEELLEPQPMTTMAQHTI
jgi:hypothetical protein